MHDGYSFTINRKFHSGMISWKCTKYKKWKCHARAVTKYIGDTECVKMCKRNHSHPPDTDCKKTRSSFDVIYE